MPEWNEETKQWDDWVGQPMSEAKLAKAGRKREYQYAMENLGRYINKDLTPELRAPLIADLQKNLQEQYFGKKGLAADRIGQESNLGVAGIRAKSAENVASITGAAQVEASKGYGSEGDRIEAESNMEALRFSRQADEDDISKVNRGDNVALPGMTQQQTVDNSVKPDLPGRRMGGPLSPGYEEVEPLLLKLGLRKKRRRERLKEKPIDYWSGL